MSGRRSKVVVPKSEVLRAEVLDKLDGFLAGRLSTIELSNWAVRQLPLTDLRLGDELIAAAIRGMLPAAHLRREDTESHLREIQAALTGKGTYTIRYMQVPPEEMKRLYPDLLAPTDFPEDP